MKIRLDKIIITNLPSFYKINLFNEIAKEIDILVIFTGHGSQGRNSDFYLGDRNFQYIDLNGLSRFSQIRKLIKVLKKYEYKELILGGWDHILLWTALFLSPTRKNSVIVESSYMESTTSGLKGLIKKIFIKRIKKAYVSGRSQKKILDNLNYKNECIVTKGVGIFNIVPQPKYEPSESVKKYLYVGRLAEEKNLKFLIEVFNKLPALQLHIAGFGPQEKELKQISKDNIHFLGAIDNKNLPEIYQSMDVFILPSKSEPWGMVVEEALNNGLPVIVSNRVGCAEEIVNSKNGLIFETENSESLNRCLKEIQDLDFYNSLRNSISQMNFNKIAKNQVLKYI